MQKKRKMQMLHKIWLLQLDVSSQRSVTMLQRHVAQFNAESQ